MCEAFSFSFCLSSHVLVMDWNSGKFQVRFIFLGNEFLTFLSAFFMTKK